MIDVVAVATGVPAVRGVLPQQHNCPVFSYKAKLTTLSPGVVYCTTTFGKAIMDVSVALPPVET